jgi:hypothetical protein
MQLAGSAHLQRIQESLSRLLNSSSFGEHNAAGTTLLNRNESPAGPEVDFE